MTDQEKILTEELKATRAAGHSLFFAFCMSFVMNIILMGIFIWDKFQ
jgi:hypothetical protein